jgi:hypothetical protein
MKKKPKPKSAAKRVAVRKRAEKPPKPREISESVRALARLILAWGEDADRLQEFAESQAWTASDLKTQLADSRRLIHAAADFDAKVEFLRAKHRLERVYELALDAEDLGVAVASQRELDRLLGLFAPREQANLESAIAQAVANYLHPLGLTKPEHPPAEHIRLAALRIADLSARQGLRIVS